MILKYPTNFIKYMFTWTQMTCILRLIDVQGIYISFNMFFFGHNMVSAIGLSSKQRSNIVGYALREETEIF